MPTSSDVVEVAKNIERSEAIHAIQTYTSARYQTNKARVVAAKDAAAELLTKSLATVQTEQPVFSTRQYAIEAAQAIIPFFTLGDNLITGKPIVDCEFNDVRKAIDRYMSAAVSDATTNTEEALDELRALAAATVQGEVK